MTTKEAFSLSETDAAAVIAQVWERVREWRVYFEQYGVPATEIENTAPAFRHIDHVSSAALRRTLP
jgi:serine/threonine-protein kinase HipA